MLNFFSKNKSKGLPKRFWNDEDLSKREKEEIRKDYLFGKCLTGAEFIEILDSEFTPGIKSLGFKGRKNNFYKVDDSIIKTIGIFKNKYGGDCSLTLGVHIKDFPIRNADKFIENNKFTPSHSMIQKTLELDNGNHIFRFGKTKEEGLETVDLMKATLKIKGIAFFEKFSNYPHPFDKIKITDLEKPNDKFSEFGITEKMLVWVHFKKFLARFNHLNGNNEFALKILKKVRNDEYYSKRFTSVGVSPLIEGIDEMIKNYS